MEMHASDRLPSFDETLAFSSPLQSFKEMQTSNSNNYNCYNNYFSNSANIPMGTIIEDQLLSAPDCSDSSTNIFSPPLEPVFNGGISTVGFEENSNQYSEQYCSPNGSVAVPYEREIYINNPNFLQTDFNEPIVHSNGESNRENGIIHRRLSEQSVCSNVSSTSSDFMENGYCREAKTHVEPTQGAKRKRCQKFDSRSKTCDVCGDVAKSLHFGGMACDSCKAFFRRSVQQKTHNSFKCSAQQNCIINKETRKNCQSCRFQKCLLIGMEVKWVMPESERIELWRAKLARHRMDKAPQNENQIVPVKDSSTSNYGIIYTDEDRELIKHLIILHEVTFLSCAPFPTSCNTTEELSTVFYCFCHKLQRFYCRLEEFQRLCPEDQNSVIKRGISMGVYLHGAFLYNSELNCWSTNDVKAYMRTPIINEDVLAKFTGVPEIYNFLILFYRRYGEEIKDEGLLLILCIIALFNGPLDNIQDKHLVTELRNAYINLLKRYLVDYYGEQIGLLKLPFLLNSYDYVTKITGYHNKVSFEPSKALIQQQFELRQSPTLNAIIDNLRAAISCSLPKYSSVFDKSSTLCKKGGTIAEKDQQFAYAWLTSVIFGSETKSDKLLSFIHPEILIQKRPISASSQPR